MVRTCSNVKTPALARFRLHVLCSTSVLKSGNNWLRPQNGWVNWPTHRKTERMYPWHLGMMWVCLKNDWTWSVMEYARISPTQWVKFWLSMGKMMTIKQWILGYHIFRQTHSHVSRFFSGYIQTSRYHGRVSVPKRQTKSVVFQNHGRWNHNQDESQ